MAAYERPDVESACANYQNIEQILRYILNRASRDNKEKERTLNKLFELLGSFAERSIGKRFGLDKVYNSRQALIEAVTDKE